MNLKNILLICSVAFMLLIAIGSVSAVDSNAIDVKSYTFNENGAKFTIDANDYQMMLKENDVPIDEETWNPSNTSTTKKYLTNKNVNINIAMYKKVKQNVYKNVPVYAYKKVKATKLGATQKVYAFPFNSNCTEKYIEKMIAKFVKKYPESKWKYISNSYTITSKNNKTGYFTAKYYIYLKKKTTYYKKVKYVHHYKKVKTGTKYVWKKVKTYKQKYPITASIRRWFMEDEEGQIYTCWVVDYWPKNFKYNGWIKGNYKYVPTIPSSILGLSIDESSTYMGYMSYMGYINNDATFSKKIPIYDYDDE